MVFLWVGLATLWKKGRNSTVSTMPDQIQISQRYIHILMNKNYSHPCKLVLVVWVIYYWFLIVFDGLKDVQGCWEMMMRKIITILIMIPKFMMSNTGIETLLRPFSTVMCRFPVNFQYNIMEMESRRWNLNFTKGYIPINLLNLEVQDGIIRKREGGNKEWNNWNCRKDMRGKIMMTLQTLIFPYK